MNIRNSTTRRGKVLGICAVLVGIFACTVVNLHAQVKAPARAPRISGFGVSNFAISTKSASAQEFFKQGLLQAYSFNEAEAVRAFKAALQEDPDCAMCAWGVAYQLGPTMVRPGRAQANEISQYMALAKQNLETVTPLERELIEALAVRYAEGKQAAELTMEFGAICSSVPTSDKIDPRDLAYAAKMRQVAQKNATNPDVLTLYAESELLTIPGNFWIGQTGKPIGRAGEIADRLEAMLVAHPSHVGLNHYMTHVADVNAVARRAVPAAERLASLAPASPHLQHMSTHIFMRVGRYSDAIQANVAALAAEDKLDVQLRNQGFEPVKNWRPHNSQFLMISALMAGRGDIALDIARTISRRAEGAQSSMGEFSRSQPLLVLLRLERYKDLLRETRPAGQRGVASILYLYSRGVALAKTHDLAGATAALAEMRPLVTEALTSHASENFPDRMVRAIVQVAQDTLSAEVAAQSGEKDKAIEFAKNAAKIGEPLSELDPPMLAADPRLALGDMQLRLARWHDAEQTFQDDLTINPRSAWALRGMSRALLGLGKKAEAAKIEHDMATAWPLADPQLRRVR